MTIARLGRTVLLVGAPSVLVASLLVGASPVSAGPAAASDRLVAATSAPVSATGIVGWGADDSLPVNALPAAPLDGVTVAKIAVGVGSACALGDNGRVYCWGAGSSGQLGTGSLGASLSPLAVRSSGAMGGRAMVDIAVGGSFACAVDVDGVGYCWGSSSKLGAGSSVSDGSVPNRLEPFSAVSGRKLVSITAGGSHACALDDSGLAYCWGDNGAGQLGDGTTTSRTVPVAAASPSDGSRWAALSAGEAHTCGVSVLGELSCWGYGSYGQLGSGNSSSSAVPVSVGAPPDSSAWAAVSSGAGHTCGVTTGGGLACWGWNAYGQLGDGTGSSRMVPTAVGSSPDSASWASVDAGRYHTCARSSLGAVSCWGANESGQLGDGGTTQRSTPSAVDSPAGVTWVAVSAGSTNSCAVSGLGAAYCWGSASQGALGSSTQLTNATAPVAVETSGALDGAAFEDVAVGGAHACALSEGEAYCWGSGGSGQLGNGAAYDTQTPVPVDTEGVLAGRVLVDIEAGYAHTCAVDDQGAAYCWGAGQYGQLGNAATASSLSPVSVVRVSAGLLNEAVTQLAVAGSTTCALTQSRRVFCWGLGDTGQIGDGSRTSRQVPVLVDMSWLSEGDDVVGLEGAAPSASLYWYGERGSFCLTTLLGQIRCWGPLGGLPGLSRPSSPALVSPTGLPSGTILRQVVLVWDDPYYVGTLCALDLDGVVYCLGSNNAGQLGNGTTNYRSSWGAVAPGELDRRPVARLASAGASVCAVDTGGRAYCWGDNQNGQLGDGTTTRRTLPVRVSYGGALAGRPVLQLAGQGSRFLALSGDGPLVAEAPDQPSAVPADASMTVTWTAPLDTGGQAVTGYRLRYSSDHGATWSTVSPDLGAAARSTSISSLENGTGYVVQVAALTSAGPGAWSANSAVATPRTLPSSPGSVVASSGDSRVDLAWSSPDDTGGSPILSYVVSVSPSAGLATVSGNTAAITGLSNGTSYSITVSATNAAGTGPASAPVSATPEPGPGAPTAVTGTPGNGQVELAWQAPTEVEDVILTGYAIQVSTDGGSSWSSVSADTGTTSRTYVVSSLANGTSYSFRVAARANARQGLWSLQSLAVTPRTTPSAPDSVSATAGDSRLSVTWALPSDGGAPILGYRIEYSSDGGANWTVFTSNSGSSARSEVVTGLTNGMPYLVRVAAINAAGTGLFAAAASAATPVPDVPIEYSEDPGLAAPSQVCAYTKHRAVTVSWNAASGAQGYVVEYREQGGDWTQVRVSTGQELTIDGLSNGTRYQIRVAATRLDERRSRWGSGCLMSWGSSRDFALGNTRRTNTERWAPAEVRATPNLSVASLTAGWSNACLITDSGDPYCWGSSRYGQLGGSWYIRRPLAVMSLISQGDTAAGTLGTNAACAISVTHQLRCLGLNSAGQLGVGDTTNRGLPTAVAGDLSGVGVGQASMGENHGCAVTLDGRVACWGLNVDGQVNASLGATVLSPVWVGGVLSGETVTAVSAGQTHSCALTTTGRVACWGGDYSGQVGNGPEYQARNQPVWVGGVIDSAGGSGEVVTSLDAGANHTCVLTDTGRAACWGANSSGQLGTGTRLDKTAPAWVDSTLPQSGLSTISAGGASTCASGSALDTYCWGLGRKGRLGNGDGKPRLRPTKVLGMLAGANASRIQVGGAFALAMWGGWTTPGHAASPPRDLTVRVTGPIATLEWFAPRLSGGLPVTGYRVQMRTNAADPWETVDTVSGPFANVTLTHQGFTEFRVMAMTDVGEGRPSDVVEALLSTDARTVRTAVPLTVTTSWGAPLAGARVTWASRDGVFSSVSPVTTDASGYASLPQVVTGPVNFQIVGGTATARQIQLGSATMQVSVPGSGGVALVPPGDWTRVSRTITIRMIDGTPIPDADLVISGGLAGIAQSSVRVGDRVDEAVWTAPGFSSSVVTNAFGQVTVSGFKIRGSTRDVRASYSNGYLRQARDFRLLATTNARFEQMPLTSIVSVSSTSLTRGDSAVVTVRATDENGSPVQGRTVTLESVTVAGVTARTMLGAASCSSGPTGVTDASGLASISVCPSATAQWRAVAESMVPSTPVTLSVTAPAPAPGPAPGPAPVPAPGPAPEPEPEPSPSPTPTPAPSPGLPVPVVDPPKPGGGAGLVGGELDPNFSMEAEPGARELIIEGTGFELALQSGTDGAIDDRGALVIAPGGRLGLAGGGFAANGPVSVFIDPPVGVQSAWARLIARAAGQTVYVGDVIADDRGALSGDLDVPADVAPGDRVLQLVGTTSSGVPMVLTLGIAVEQQGVEEALEITGKRGKGKNRLKVTVRGQYVGGPGTVVYPWVKVAGKRSFARGASVSLSTDGSFLWKRKIMKKARIYFTSDGGSRSNTITIAAPPRR